MITYVVRHAHAGRRETWEGDDSERPLSALGERQAVDLVAVFAGRPVARILSSPYLRCTATVAPLAADRGLPVEPTDALGEGSPRQAVRDLLAEAGPDAVLCSHGDVIGDLVGELRLRGVPLPARPRWAKGSTWVVEHEAGRWKSATYLRPPH